MGPGFFPLDEELGLLPGRLTPRLQEALVRLGTHLPSFAKAAAELAFVTGVVVHPDTARRHTEAAGARSVAQETADATHILHTHPAPPPGPQTLLFSVDGAMIPLVEGQWAEVRTLAVGAVAPPEADGAPPHTTDLSYFSRLASSQTFADLALRPLHLRGIERAGRVGVVVDGAEWCQSFIDLHAPTAVRILDFPHAAEYLTAIAQTVGPQGTLIGETELSALRKTLKHAGPDPVLARLWDVVGAYPQLPQLTTRLAYLEKRVAQMTYPKFVADGWPIGSGMVESANKLVVEDRLKGAGMHWAEANVNPLLALRNAICNERWTERWTVIEGAVRRQLVVRRQRRQEHRAKGSASPPAAVPQRPAPVPTAPTAAPAQEPGTAPPVRTHP